MLVFGKPSLSKREIFAAILTRASSRSMSGSRRWYSLSASASLSHYSL
jgi:hypothetical protein